MADPGPAPRAVGKDIEADHRSGRHSNPAGAGRPGEVSARALNKLPICAGSIKRRRPLSRSSRVAGDACTANGDCESNLCTKESYDRKPGPVCTYNCDPANPNPKCPNGCNMKGFCKIPT